jgi:hypothetical protein
MNGDDFLKKAKERLAEIESEAIALRAFISAMEGTRIEPVRLTPFHPALPAAPWTPDVPWPLDRVTCASSQTIIGGPQRIDPNVRFAS